MKKITFNKSVFAFPYIFICAIFVIFPLMLIMIYAFKGQDGGFSLMNFWNVITNKYNYTILFKTILTALITTGICLVISYPIALILASSRFNKITILALLFIVPMWMNFVLRIYALRSLLAMIGISYSYLAVIIGLVYDFLPFMLLPIYTILVNMDKSYIEASYDLGAGTLKTFGKVTLPLSMPGIISGIMMVFMPTFSAYAITGMLGDANSSVIGGKIETLISNNQWGAGSALAFVLLLLVIITMVIGNFVQKRNKLKNDAVTKITPMGGGTL